MDSGKPTSGPGPGAEQKFTGFEEMGHKYQKLIFPKGNRVKLSFEPNVWNPAASNAKEGFRDSTDLANHITTVDLPRAKQVRKKLVAKLRPLQVFTDVDGAPLEDDFYNRYSTKWIGFATLNVTSWHEYYAAFLMWYMYHRLMPQEDLNREPDGALYVELFDILCNTLEICSSTFAIVDDIFDCTTNRMGKPSWQLLHPHSVVNDIIQLTWTTKRIVQDCFPKDHPCKAEMMKLYAEFYTIYFSYYAYHCELAAVNGGKMFDAVAGPPGEQRAEFMAGILKNYTHGSYLQYVYNRGAYYFHIIIDVPRLMCCYTHPVVEMSCHRVLTLFNESFCLLDDLIDNNGELRAVEDIMGGEPSNVLLLCFLDHIRAEQDPKERSRLEGKFRELFGKYNQAQGEELLDLMEDCNILNGRVKPFMKDWMDTMWAGEVKTVAEKIRCPLDTMWKSLFHYIQYDSVLSDEQKARCQNFLTVLEKDSSDRRDPLCRLFDYMCRPESQFPCLPSDESARSD